MKKIQLIVKNLISGVCVSSWISIVRKFGHFEESNCIVLSLCELPFPYNICTDSSEQRKQVYSSLCPNVIANTPQRATYYRTEDSNGGGVPGCNRPKVRLRARKVLCHNCKEVCNDRGENLQQQQQQGGGIRPGDVRDG